MASEIDQCVFCKLITLTRGHHIIPKSKGGTTIVPTCETCESFIHKTWTHNELRDVYNNVDIILSNEKFQKFLKWRLKQTVTAIFKSSSGKLRDKNKYH
jgi:hypothetical protein